MTVVVSRRNVVPVGSKSSPDWGLPRSRTRTVRGSTELFYEALGLNAAYSEIYRSQPWIYVLVNKLARGVARLPLKSYARQADDARSRLEPNHPLRRLIERPFPRGSRFRLIEATVGNLAIYGNAAWWKFREQGGGSPPVELWPLDWRYMRFDAGGPSGVDHYVYDGPAGKRRILPDDLVHFSWWSPRGPAGTSPLEPLRETLALENAGRRYAVQSFANGVRPSGALVTPKTLQPEQKRELRDEISATNAGLDNAFRIALLDGGMDWKPFAHTAQEAETIAHRKINREEACAVYDIPPPAVHILDRATFSNITEQNKALYREAFGPPTVMLEETIEAQLLAPELAYLGTYVEFDMAEVLKADLPVRAAALRQLETTLTLNDRRRIENLPPIGDPTDEANPANGVLLPLNMQIVLPNGTIVDAPAGSAGQLGAALEELARDAIDRALQERELVPAEDPVTLLGE